uniref:Uncharacterized protein n=1 Tax=Ditylenchus dipsaci TaxID=166011 RepID=A0A915DFA4_9BILA
MAVPGLIMCPAEGLPMLPINNMCSLWACLTADELVLCRNGTDGCAMLVGRPDENTLHLLESFHSYTLRVDPEQHNRLQLVVEPRNAAHSPFSFSTLAFHWTTGSSSNLTLIGKSIVPAPGKSLDLSHSSSQVYINEGVIYKFYRNACFISFLRLPSLAEISFVALQKACGQKNTASGAVGQGIGPKQLNDLLDISVQWF